MTRRSGNSRRMLIAAGGLAALALVGWLLAGLLEPPPVARRITETASPSPTESLPETPSPSPAPTSVPADRPAVMTLFFEHSLKGGVLRVSVDGLRVVEQPFGSRVTRKIVGIEMRKGEITETLEVAPGLREIKVEVLWDDNRKSERSQTFFNPGSRLRLKAKLGGIRKNLSLEWN